MTGDRPVLHRLWERSVVTETGCFEWQGALTSKGYGKIACGSRADGSVKNRRVHRVAYEALVGPIPDGLTIDHTCENKACWSPAHLQPVTNAENIWLAGVRMNACRRGHARTPENSFAEQGTNKIRCRVCRREREARARRELRVVTCP